MNFKCLLLVAIFSSTAALAPAQGGTADAPRTPKHRPHAGTTYETREERLEKKVEQLEQEVEDLKAQASGGQVSSSQFEALQNQVYETQATAKAATANQAAVRFNHSHLTISSPDGKYTFSPIVDVMGDWASYSKSQPLPNGSTNGKFDLKSSGENFRRAQIGFQGAIAGDFGYKFLYDFGGSNGNETYQAFAGPNSATQVLGCNVALVAGSCPAGHTTLVTISNAFNTSTGAGSGPHIKEAWVSYRGFLAPFTFRLGALPTPANLADTTASDDLLLLERPSPGQLSRGLAADDGRESVGFTGNGGLWDALWQGSAYLTGDTFGKGALLAPQTTSGGGQEAFVGRVAIVPWQDVERNFTIHLGGNYSYVFRPQEATTNTPAGVSGVTTFPITFSDRPELRVDNVTFLNTGAINAHSAYAGGVEGAVSYGPLLIEGENFWYEINRNQASAGQRSPNFSGWYVEGSWVLTGEGRKYNPVTASFTRPSPANPFDPRGGKWGAWELAGRYSSTDLNFDTASPVVVDRVFGGNQDIWSGGINFYPNDTLKFMLDFQDVRLKDIGSAGNDGQYNTISLRAQVSY